MKKDLRLKELVASEVRVGNTMSDEVDKPWATCKYGEITETSYQMVMLGCVHPSRSECPLCYNNPECPNYAYRFKYLKR